ncbi:retinoschisin-like [Patiria miniata]|uniref:F5/8 type C domain-containing protein n=1 Tax=Patiria miniata TaxID=46514 RepID=A0A914A6U3_PATMI|nr:retinoschisin-like [Patiria miniata]
MDGAAVLVLMLSAITVFLVGVESQARTCYFGPPPEPDPDNPDHWMKQVMQEIRKRCPGRRNTTHASMGNPIPSTRWKPSPAGTEEPTAAGTEEPTPAGTEESTPATMEGPTSAGTKEPTAAKTEESTPAGKPTPTTKAECDSTEPLGMEDGTIQDSRISVPSIHGPCCRARAARLHNNKAWGPSSPANSWIEVDLVEGKVVSGVITQGFDEAYVTQYKVAYKTQPSSEYEHVRDGNGNVKVFTGNTDDHTPVTNQFDESVVATIVRIEPTAWDVWVALRLELLGCSLN